MNNSAFLAELLRIAATNPTYRTGGDGSDGTCDCVGLIMGALGGDDQFPIHSSNWFARYYTDGLEMIDRDRYEPAVCDVLYKGRNPNNPKYALDDKYTTGRYATGDLMDYYHIGVVINVAPLEIMHCTSTNNINGIAYDGTLDGWTHTGWVKGVEVTEPWDEADGEPLAETESYPVAIVSTKDGKAVRIRSKPTDDEGYNTIEKAPCGAQVEVLESAGEWATVRFHGVRGYMMTEFLRFGNEKPQEGKNDAVTIPRETAQALLDALMQALN